MASSTGNIKQAYDVNGEKIYPKVILDAIEGEGGKTGMEIIKEAVGGIGMENLKGVSVEYDDIDGIHHLVFKSHYEESAGGYIKETIVGEGPVVIGNYSETNPYANDHIYVSKNLSILGDANTLEFVADADAVTSRNISGKIAHTNNSIQIINNNAEGKLELFGGGEGAEDCVSISADLMNIPKNVSILKNLSVSGNTTVATTSGATLSVGGNATFSNTITVNGKSSFKNDVSLDGQTAFRGSSPKLSFTSYENKTNSTNRATGYIVEHYGTSNNTSLEMYDGTESNAHLSLSGSDKTFTVKVNSNNALILDGSNKVAKIQPYSSDENSPSLVIDGSKKTTTLKSDNNTKLVLDASNAVLYGDSYRYMELDGSNGKINLNASKDGNTYFKLYGNSSIDLQADNNRYLYMPANDTKVILCADGDENGDTYLELNGNTSQPYTKLSSLSDMRLGMNDVSGHLTLQAKKGTYLEFDVSGNNKSVGLHANDNYYLQIDASSKKANLHADVSSYLQIDASIKKANLYADASTYLNLSGGSTKIANLYANDSTYLKLLGGTSKKANLYADASSYLQIDASSKEANLHANDNYYLQIDASTKIANLYANDSTYLNLSSSGIKKATLHADASTYLNLLSGTSKKATLYADASTYLNLLSGSNGRKILLYANDNNRIDINSEVLSSTIPMTAKVNGVSDVYVGCPIGTIVMWAGLTSPDGWLICDGRGIALKTPYSEGVTVHQGFEDYQKLVDVIKNKYGSGTGTTTWVPNTGTIQGSPYVSIPDIQQRFPLGAKTGTLNNGFDSSGNQLTVDTSLGKKGGDSEVKLYAKTMPTHSHNVYSNAASTKGGNSTEFNYIKQSDSYTSMTTTKTGGGKEHSNMPPYLAINFIIKYK